ncbi:bifunctional hydroxymethylpyrimidine kinase/phosphomethylpyrimidine kinase [Haloarchaeobius iranensis]|uniref:Hydroxymethylpyrimidine/phosphomethylpyrimidine kinase n=1 Tax=Haloarchaeobius iranensis TaxID=996166 RepID=A0A1G9XP27_9EURY|nr:bifunctional hydroxymethylpyrimidine kinase/phosphomethylpyrimidine kinase [Haloarchaeobius iranensis]SDM98480.1 hydroxymethylpyrimidine/phosphomethylpyrimidine kinase [Haloarchaeobius iranensis]
MDHDTTRERRPAADARPVALTVAGSDSGGGAGIQADLATMGAHGAWGTSALTSVTAQHTRGVDSTHVLPPDEVAAQVDAVFDDFDVRAVKTGMLATAPVIETVHERLAARDVPVVVDPVMVATSGDRLLDREAESAYEDLVSDATLVTPNADEAAVLTGTEPTDTGSACDAGADIVAMGADAALVKGGHIDTDGVVDVLVTADDAIAFEHPRVADAATHGSGCTLSAAVAANLATGDDLTDAVEAAVDFVARAIRYHADVGANGAVNHHVALRNRAAARETIADIERVVDDLVAADASALIPEVGTNVVGALPFAESVDETVAVDGRVASVHDGVRPTGGVRFGASSHVARFLLSAREYDPALRFACNCRFDESVADAVEELDWPSATYDRSEEPADASTMDWAGRSTFGAADETPVAVLDHGAHGKEPICKLVAPDAGTLSKRVLALLDVVEG